jgi:hypothetical protein
MTRAPLESMACRKKPGVCESEAASSMVFRMRQIRHQGPRLAHIVWMMSVVVQFERGWLKFDALLRTLLKSAPIPQKNVDGKGGKKASALKLRLCAFGLRFLWWKERVTVIATVCEHAGSGDRCYEILGVDRLNVGDATYRAGRSCCH